MLSPQQVSIITSTVPLLSTHGEAVTSLFYRNLLRDVPCLRSTFNATHQATGHQPRALAAAILAYAQHITDISPLAAFVEAVCHKHASLGVSEAQYALVGTYLLASFEEVLGTSVFTAEVKAAWEEAYAGLAQVMIQREKELYADGAEWSTSGWEDMEIVDKVRESDAITSFYLRRARESQPAAPPHPLPTYLPGQYVSVRVRLPGTDLMQPRQYSLSSHHHDAGQQQPQRPQQYRISVKREPARAHAHAHAADAGDAAVTAPTHATDADAVSRILHEEKVVGDRVQISRPRGTFVLERRRSASGHSHLGDAVLTGSDTPAPAPVVLISAGVGITPMMSMLQYLAGAASPPPVRFLHAAKNPQTQAFAREVEAAMARLNGPGGGGSGGADAASSESPRARAHFFYSESTPGPSASPSAAVEEGPRHAFTTLHPPGERLSLSGLARRKDCTNDDADADPLLLADERTQYYVCGPAAFMEDICGSLVRDFGVDEGRVRMEKFSV